MKHIKFLLTGAIVWFLSLTTTAQVSGDSLHSLKQQKQSLELSTKINDLKMKLAKLENTLDKKTREMESTTTAARQAADDNATAAVKLSSDAQDKKLARQAESTADNAKKSAKRARVAADNLADLKREIETLKSKITEDEARLVVNAVAIPVQQ
jgi:chromosome segregation ATPase